MASKAIAEKWLAQLTHLPTASGREDEVMAWVKTWVSRRTDLMFTIDTGGNILITQKGRKRWDPVTAVAHMDHPAFVVTGVEGRSVHYEFRGSVNPEYFTDARVEFRLAGSAVRGRVAQHDSESGVGIVRLDRAADLQPGDIGMWVFRRRSVPAGRFAAPACDDLAGVAASLAALDRTRGNAELRHFSVLLTRAEEVGLVGAIHAARTGSIPLTSRLFSIETSRELPEARIGDGPIIRVGDAMTVFDRELTNLVTVGAQAAGLKHQRKLMSGGGCEASAFGLLGYRATGLCLALGNWHNRGNLSAVEAGTGEAIPMTEEISLDDFHGLVELLLVAAGAVDGVDPQVASLSRGYEQMRRYLT